ncbi:MAG: TfoX/Sxy family protein [Gaiella sp.]
MAYDEELAHRVRAALADASPSGTVEERKMFGGLCFLVGGHMACGLVGDTLMLRLGEEGADAALARPHTRPMDFTGKPMRTMVYVEPEGIATKRALASWVGRAAAFVATLPRKGTSPARP